MSTQWVWIKPNHYPTNTRIITIKSYIQKKRDLTDNVGIDDKKLKIMSYKNQEQILFENALRSILSILPNGHQYEIYGNVRLVAKNVEQEIQDKSKQRK